MCTQDASHRESRPRGELREWLAHLAVIVAVSAAFESLFLHHGIGWLFDEGWPLYAAMQLQDGGTLYGDVFFLFPPGHLLPAYVAHALDPPGVVLARIFYAGFNVALCVAIYALGRNLMRPTFALLAALLLAVAAPRSHLVHLLFGYRYLIFSVLALLAFSARLRSGRRGWLVLAGVATGVALSFRISPAFAVSCAIAIAVMSADRDWRVWLRDWGATAIGLAAVLAPVLATFAAGAGIEAFWSQAVVRILPLQAAQSKPIPELVFPTSWDRQLIYEFFVPIQYWLYPILYAGYAAVLGTAWFRCARRGRAFPHALLLAVTVWGAIYILRTLGRSDEHHLMSALPPVCLLLAHVASTGFEAVRPRAGGARMAQLAVCATLLALWVLFQGSDLYLDPDRRGVHPVQSLAGRVRIRDAAAAARLDRSVARIRELTEPDERILDLTHAPLLYVLAERRGPGYGDVVTPGVFDDPGDLRAFIERLEKSPPALVLWPQESFDGMPLRSLDIEAPLLAQWVRRNYVRVDRGRLRAMIMMRRP